MRGARHLLAISGTALAGLASGAAWTVAPRALDAQGISGRVVDATTGRVVPGAPVRLLRPAPRDTTAPADTTPLASGMTSADGVFFLAAPGPGTYRARIGDDFFSPPVSLASADGVAQLEYRLAPAVVQLPDGRVVTRAMLDSALRSGRPLLGFQVEKTAATVPGTLQARYPDVLRQRYGGGKVIAQFVVDTSGRADMSTFKALVSSDVAFTNAARGAVASARFYPAEIAKRKVRQLVQLPFTFALSGPEQPPPFGPPALFEPSAPPSSTWGSRRFP